MKIAWLVRCAVLCGVLMASSPAQTVDVPLSAAVEAIEFKDVPQATQRVVLERIGLQVGDVLGAEARQRIGRELGKVRRGMTFTYKPGSKRGTARLIINGDC